MKKLLLIFVLLLSSQAQAKGLVTHLIAGGVGYAIGKSSQPQQQPQQSAQSSQVADEFEGYPVNCWLFKQGYCSTARGLDTNYIPIPQVCPSIYGAGYEQVEFKYLPPTKGYEGDIRVLIVCNTKQPR